MRVSWRSVDLLAPVLLFIRSITDRTQFPPNFFPGLFVIFTRLSSRSVFRYILLVFTFISLDFVSIRVYYSGAKGGKELGAEKYRDRVKDNAAVPRNLSR